MIKKQATRNLNNFLSSHTLQESTELLNQLCDMVLVGTHHVTLDEKRKEKILDFLESIEELNYAVHELYATQE